jgi:hypothetical protein
MMKRILALTALCLPVILAAPPSHAQSGGTLVAKIPFEFIVGNTRLPAGDYIIDNYYAWGRPLRIQSTDGRAGAFGTLTSPLRTNARLEKSKLVFRQYGDHYFLAEVWAAGSDEGCKLFRSRLERKVEAVASADSPRSYQTVTIIARSR